MKKTPKIQHIFIWLLLVLNSISVQAQYSDKQVKTIDSLKQLVDSGSHDSVAIKAYIEWDNIIYYNDPKLDLELNQKVEILCDKNLKQTLTLSEKQFYQRFLSTALANIGLIYQNQGDFSKSIDYNFKSLKISEEIGDTIGMGTILFNLGQIYINIDDYTNALLYHKKNIELNQLSGNKKRVANSLNSIGVVYKIQGDFPAALDYLSQSLKIREEINDKKGIAIALNDIGILYENKGDYEKAIENFLKSIKIDEVLGDKKDIANSLNNIGLIYKNQGNHPKAIDYLSRSLKIREELNDKTGIATSLNNIGLIYHDQTDYESALDYYQRCLNINEEIGDQRGIAASINNIGLIYHDQNKYDKALEYYEKGLKMKEEIGDKKSIAISLNNIGSIFDDQGAYDKALDYQNRSLKIREEIGDKKGIATSLNNIGMIYKNKGEYPKAIRYCSKSLALAREIGAIIEIKQAADALYDAYKKSNRNKEALEMHELYIELRDSINSEENRKEVIRQEYKYQYEKQAIADSIKNQELQKVKDAQLAAQKAENKQQKLKSTFLYIGLFFTLLFGAFIFHRFRITRKQKGIIETQKKQVDEAFDELDEKNKEILASINYAKRIQSAILPSESIIKEHLTNSFILYKPKDIVAGDFYWFEVKEDKVLFAAADCTGHGVPGAMVSVVCNNGLNRSAREFNLSEPGKILDKTRELIIHEFEKGRGDLSEGEVRDGMDIALCSLSKNQLKYAGAYNPLWIFRKGEIIEIKADKQPIGKFDDLQPFSTHSLELEKGDTLYIFSDGYVDQFGGPKGKKLKAKAFKALLLEIQNEPIEKQRQLLDDAFEAWRGTEDQVDDVVVMGVRI